MDTLALTVTVLHNTETNRWAYMLVCNETLIECSPVDGFATKKHMLTVLAYKIRSMQILAEQSSKRIH